MTSSKEKIKLNKVLSSLADVDTFNEPNLLIVNEAFIEYSKIIRVLYKNSPNVFANLYNYDLAEIRGHKRNVKEDFADEEQQSHFKAYRDALVHASESAIEYITDYIQL
jgi:ferritin-like protein